MHTDKTLSAKRDLNELEYAEYQHSFKREANWRRAMRKNEVSWWDRVRNWLTPKER